MAKDQLIRFLHCIKKFHVFKQVFKVVMVV